MSSDEFLVKRVRSPALECTSVGVIDEAFGGLDGAYLEITLKDGLCVGGIARIDATAAHPLHLEIAGALMQIPLGRIRDFKDLSSGSDEMPEIDVADAPHFNR